MKIKITLIIMLAVVSFSVGRLTKEPAWEIPRLLSDAGEQRELARLGFYDGPIDGVRGPLHIQAKKDYELAYCDEQASWAMEKAGVK